MSALSRKKSNDPCQFRVKGNNGRRERTFDCLRGGKRNLTISFVFESGGKMTGVP